MLNYSFKTRPQQPVFSVMQIVIIEMCFALFSDIIQYYKKKEGIREETESQGETK